MRPLRIIDANANLGAPEAWDAARNGDCGTLPVRVICREGGPSYFESAWRPTAAELAMLNRGGVVMLRTIGVQPPVSLNVGLAGDAEEIEPAMGLHDYERKAG